MVFVAGIKLNVLAIIRVALLSAGMTLHVLLQVPYETSNLLLPIATAILLAGMQLNAKLLEWLFELVLLTWSFLLIILH